MANNRTFTELDGNVISNGTYTIHYVMENGAPRFVLVDLFKSLGYKTPHAVAHIYCKSLGLGKVVGKDNKLRTYATKEEMESIFDRMYFMTPEFRDFWELLVVPATDAKYAALRNRNARLVEANSRLESTNKKLEEVYNVLRAKNASLAEKLDEILQDNTEIENILGMTA